MATFSERLKYLRIKNGFTQEQLAKTFFITKSSISKYENGVNSPENKLLQGIADFFEVSINYLLGRTNYFASTFDKWEPTLNNKDSKYLYKIAENFENGLSGDIMLDGDIIDNETKELLLKSIRHAYEFANISNKAKYTPNKFRK